MKLFGTLRELVAAVFRKDGHEITLRPNQTSSLYTTNRAVSLPQVDNDVVLTASGYIANPDIAAAAGIVDTKLATIATAGKVSNSATTATDANTPSAIVARNASGDFSAGTITANLTGNVSGSAASFTGSLSGEVTGTQSATVVADNVIDNDNIKSNAAIAYSKLALTGSIVNADLAGSIDAAKIGSGSVSNTEFGYLDGVTSSIQTQLGGKAASGANSDITSLSGLTTALSISQGGTGQTSASAAINALLPSQATNFNKYLKTDGTNVSWASASGGAGEINAVLNASGADGTSGWINGTSHSINTVTGATIPLSPAVPTAFTMSSSAAVAIGSQTSSSGDYYEFTMPPALRNRKLKFEFYYTTPAAADGTWGVAVYNGATKVRLSTDTGATPDTVLPAGVSGGKFTAYFDTDSGTTYRVNFVQRTRTNTNSLWVTNVVVGPGIQPQGAVVGEWVSYTPTATNFTVGNGTLTGLFRRVGSNAEIRIDFNSGTTSSYTTTNWKLSLPSGLTWLIPSNTAEQVVFGTATGLFNDGTNGESRNGVVVGLGLLPDATSVYIKNAVSNADYTNLYWNSTTTGVSNALTGTRISLNFTVPIAEWAGSGTLTVAQNDVEYAFNSSTSTGNDGSSFGYGPQGAPVQAFAPTGTTAILKRIKFQTPIQATDIVTVELMDPTSNFWTPASSRLFGIFSSNDAGTVYYGIDIDDTTAQGECEVRFYSKTGNKVQAWSDLATAGWRWRVRKASAGAAVGFGIVQPGTSAGLVSASGLPGNTTGNPIASGYVGEVVLATIPNNTALTLSEATVSTLTLPSPGIWQIFYSVTTTAVGPSGVGNYTYAFVGITDNNNARIASSWCPILSFNQVQIYTPITRTLPPITVTSANLTYKLRALKFDAGGTGTAAIENDNANRTSYFYAVRIA